jgi:serine/threonine-protein kinase
VGKYVLLEEVKSGGMGVVYKARDTELDRIVALKMIKGGLLATDEEMQRFRREARAIARLDHPNIVAVYENGQEEGRLYFTMAFAWGGSLAQQQGRSVADPSSAAALLEKIARAVHYAHQRGIFHRDLKPANILFDERGNPWVADFGLAKFVDGSLELTRPGQLLGTPAYMAPEQANGHTDQFSAQTDVWGLGVLLYELLTGQRPFKGETPDEQFDRVLTMEPRRPRTINRSVDRGLETVVLKCLEKEPSRRYASAEALADDLARWQRGEPVLARPPGRLERAWRAVRRHARLTAALFLLAMLALTAALAWYWFDPERSFRNIEERLERGESVVLIPETGKPRWFSITAGGEAAQASEGIGGTFTVHSWSGTTVQPGARVELVRDPHRESYRLRAEVQHRKGGPGSQVGLYVLDRPLATSQGPAHSLLLWTFNDLDDLRAKFAEKQKQFTERHGILLQHPAPKGNYVTLRFNLLLEKPPRPTAWGVNASFGSGTFEPFIANKEQDSWRRLAVEVTPRTIRCFWNGQLACEQSFTDLTARARQRLRERNRKYPGSPPVEEEMVNFSPRGRLGLCVCDGSASFRRVVIEPLEEGE